VQFLPAFSLDAAPSVLAAPLPLDPQAISETDITPASIIAKNFFTAFFINSSLN
jgi:hypothetical protein